MARVFIDGRLEHAAVAANRPSRVERVRHCPTLPSATVGETLGVVARVLAPFIAEGPIIRRPRIVGLSERLDLHRRAVEYLQQLRRRRRGPLMFGPVRGRTWALVLSPRHAQRVLTETPDPFATASAEKIAALAHFEPCGALISHGAERAERRALNEAALETGRPVHGMADAFTAVVDEEVDELLATTGARELAWPAFSTAWFRIVRRIVFGDAARDDWEVTDLLARLRTQANWAFLRPIQAPVRDRFLGLVHERLAAAPPGTLAAAMLRHRPGGTAAPDQQVPQWLFAFDAAGMATLRAAALLATHPMQAVRARQEMRAARQESGVHELRYLRACVLESLRLWPTTPLLLRQTVEETFWDECVMPAQTGVVIVAPFFHRDDERLPFAHRFWPEVWLQDRPPEEVWTLLPFSHGPARCPGRQLVELVASTLLARLFDGRKIALTSHPCFGPHRPLPVTLGHHTLRFTIA